MKRRPSQLASHHRHGTIMPCLVMVILAICAAGALVLDRLWIDAAQVQLNAAAEAAALAAAGRLACDERLQESWDAADTIDNAIAAADVIAQSNYVAGQAIRLDLSSDGDIRFGRIVDNPTTGQETFLQTHTNPTTVHVVAQSLRKRQNPLSLFFRGVTGQSAANAQGQAQATIENRIVGIRPLPGTAVPCLPIGILETDPTGTQQNTWKRQIDQRAGQDHFGFDAASQTLVTKPDGIPELALTVTDGDVPDNANVQLVDLGTNLSLQRIQQQIAGGLTEDDMESFGGELILDRYPMTVNASLSLVRNCVDDLKQQIGKTRLCLLYQVDAQGKGPNVGRTFVTRLVALRLLKIELPDGGPIQVVVQPSVIATRTAMLSDNADAYRNPYVYKLYLTQ